MLVTKFKQYSREEIYTNTVGYYTSRDFTFRLKIINLNEVNMIFFRVNNTILMIFKGGKSNILRIIYT